MSLKLYRSDMEATENSLLAKHHQRGAQSPETSHHVQGKNGAEKKWTFLRIALGEYAGVEKKETQRHDHAEKEKHFIAQRQLHAHAREGNEIGQSRSLLPVSSMNTSSSEGVAISSAGQFVTGGIEMLDERNDCRRGTGAVQNVSAVDFARVNDPFERFQFVPMSIGLRQTDFHACGVGGSFLEFARSAESNELAVIDDAYPVAQALGLFDVMRGKYDRLFLALQLFDDVVNLAAHLRVESRRGFIEEKNFGIVDKGHGQGQTLFLSARKLAVEGVSLSLPDRNVSAVRLLCVHGHKNWRTGEALR